MAGTSWARRKSVDAGDPTTGAGGNVVERDGQAAGGVGHRAEVLVEAALRGSVVVRRHHQHSIDAARLGAGGQLHRVVGVVRTCAGDNRDGDGRRHGAPQVALLLVGEDRALAGGPAEHQAVAAVTGQPAGQLDRRVEVEGTRIVERGHHGGDDAPEAGRVGLGAHEHLTLPVASDGSRPDRWPTSLAQPLAVGPG